MDLSVSEKKSWFLSGVSVKFGSYTNLVSCKKNCALVGLSVAMLIYIKIGIINISLGNTLQKNKIK